MKNRFVIVYIFSFLLIYGGDISPSIHFHFILVFKMICTVVSLLLFLLNGIQPVQDQLCGKIEVTLKVQ